jgi:soluble lytic murein transglycosylase-like protein
MGKMIMLGTAAALMGTAIPASTDRVSQWQAFITEASRRFDVPERWIWHVIAVESAGNVQANGLPIRSPVGAMGLMQLMPATWATIRDSLHLGSDPDDPHDNIIAGTAYLRSMYDSFGYPGLFAAYNAGPSRYADYLLGKRALPRETRVYLQTLTARTDAPAVVPDPPRPPLFVVQNGEIGSPSDGLFVLKRPLP